MSTKPDATPQQVFEHVARAICPGELWPAAVADLMGIRPDSVRQLRSGRMRMKRAHFETLQRILTERQALLKETEQQLQAWLATQPPDPPRT